MFGNGQYGQWFTTAAAQRATRPWVLAYEVVPCIIAFCIHSPAKYRLFACLNGKWKDDSNTVYTMHLLGWRTNKWSQEGNIKAFFQGSKKELESDSPLVTCSLPATVNWSMCLSGTLFEIMINGTDFGRRQALRSNLSFATCNLLNVWQIVKLLEFLALYLSHPWARIKEGNASKMLTRIPITY